MDDNEQVHRNLRQKYRELIMEAEQNLQISGTLSDVEELSKALDNVDKIFESAEVLQPNEAALDSQFLLLCATKSRMHVQTITAGLLTFRINEFAEKLITYLGGNRGHIPIKNWISLGKQVATFSKLSPSFDFMYGSYTPVIKKSAKKLSPSINKIQANVQIMKPIRVRDIKQENHEETTTKEVEYVLKVLKQMYNCNGKQPICYFEFVVDPECFEHTIQNIFLVSFLVRDGHARIKLDADNLPVVEPMQSHYQPGIVQGKAKERQLIINISYEEWKEIIKVFEINQAMISRQLINK